MAGQNGNGQNGTDKMVRTKCQMDKMVLDKMVWTKWYGQNGMDKMAWTKWYGQNRTDKAVRTKWYGQNFIKSVLKVLMDGDGQRPSSYFRGWTSSSHVNVISQHYCMWIYCDYDCTIAISLVHSELDYCNSLSLNINSQLLHRLQLVPNSTARAVPKL